MAIQIKTPEAPFDAKTEAEVMLATASSASVISAFLKSISAIDEALAYFASHGAEIVPTSILTYHLLGARNGLVDDPRFVQDEIAVIDGRIAEFGDHNRNNTTGLVAINSFLDLRNPFAEILELEQMYSEAPYSDPTKV